MATRQRLLDAALEVFAERGTDGGSMREIARRANVNVAAAYHHFGSKRDLFLSLFRELGFVDAPENPDPWAYGAPAPEVGLAEVVLLSLMLMASGEDMIRLAVGEALKGDGEVRAVFAEWQRQGDARLRAALLRHGLATEHDVDDRAWVVRQVVWATFVESLVSERPSSQTFAEAAARTARTLEGWR